MAPRPFSRPKKPMRQLVASAANVKIGDRDEAERLRKIRQGWQAEALAYVDAIGELHYPLHFMANQTTRVRVYPAFLVDPDSPPVPIQEADGVPVDLQQAALADLERLGTGQIGLRPIMRGLYLNTKTTGEMFLLGYIPPDSDTGDEVWEVRSIDEVTIDNQGQIWLRDSPFQTSTSGDAANSMVPFPVDGYIERIWTPHQRWRALADSPMRPILDVCEELLLASRAVRAVLRSRLAGNGVALLAQELQLPGIDPTNDDPEANPVMEELTRAILTPIQDEASAAAVVPTFLTVPAEQIEKALKFITFDRPIDQHLPLLRTELIGRMATGMDWPKELVTGLADMNHWTSWMIDETTFKGHVEPDTITQCDSLTVGYARPMLTARMKWDPSLVSRVVYWYDPTELVTKPDLSGNAQEAFNGNAIGRAALRKHNGFSDDDKPDQLDDVLYTLQHLRGVDPHIAVPILKAVAPAITWPDPDTMTDGTPGADVPAPRSGEPVNEPATPGDAPSEPTAADARPAPDGPAAQAASGIIAAGTQNTGAMVALYPSPEQAATLAVDGGEDPASIHVTLAYLGQAADLTPEQTAAVEQIVTTIAGQWPALDGEFGGVARFTADGSPDGDPVVATVDVPALASMRDALCQHLAATGVPLPSEHGFTPHATLAYVEADAAMPVERMDPVPASFTAISVVLAGQRTDYDLTGVAEPLVAASVKDTDRLSRRLLDIDRQLRAKLLTAADAAVRRVLERAGARLRSKTAKDPTLRASITDVPNPLVAARIGPEGVSGLGVDPADLTNETWSELQQQWQRWVSRAQQQARTAAAQLADVGSSGPAVADLEAAHTAGLDAGWQILAAGLTHLVKDRMFNPHPAAPPLGEFDPDLTVPPGLIRQAMATAGGGAAVTVSGETSPPGAFGVGQGSAVQSFLANNGMTRESYHWIHGDTDRPLDAHLNLDGYEFTGWDDPHLVNTDTFPEVEVLAPGDHDGCSCDAWIIWKSPAADVAVAASVGM